MVLTLMFGLKMNFWIVKMNKFQFYIFWLKNRNKVKYYHIVSVPLYCIVPTSFKHSYENYLKLSESSINQVRIDGMKWIDWKLLQ
jgi:hypothetical protein